MTFIGEGFDGQQKERQRINSGYLMAISLWVIYVIVEVRFGVYHSQMGTIITSLLLPLEICILPVPIAALI